MRNEFTPQVETREISDSDLDGVSGGLGASVGGTIGLDGVSGGIAVDGITGFVTSATSALPLSTVTGLAAPLTGITGIAGL